ncbi:LIM domain-containing protein, partial [Pseudoalteromonas sp. BMB]|uniref:LIM domain-containing protein n=1 Tax=Pseudoalteromonas sp. BMB TaxID=1874619 RepID=UPI001112F6A0
MSEETEVKKIKKTKKKTRVQVDVEYEGDGPIENSEEKSELIFSGEYTKAMSKDWHSGHFCCWQCDETLTGQRYVLREE